MGRLGNGVSTAIKLWKYMYLRAPEHGDDTFSETSVGSSAIRYKVPEDIFIVIAVIAYERTMFFDH
jgi:hypothetical protein